MIEPEVAFFDIIDNMNLSNREELIEILKQAAQPSPEAQEAQQRQQQMAEELQTAQIAVFDGQANEFNARAKKYDAETRAIPVELENMRLKLVSDMDTDDERNFAQRAKIADLAIKEKSMGNRGVSNGQPTRTSASGGANQRGVQQTPAANPNTGVPSPKRARYNKRTGTLEEI
jgi:hypothetical protein